MFRKKNIGITNVARASLHTLWKASSPKRHPALKTLSSEIVYPQDFENHTLLKRHIAVYAK